MAITTLFHVTKTEPRWWRPLRHYLLHSAIATSLFWSASVIPFYLLPIEGVLVGIAVNRILRTRSAVLAVLPSLLLFAIAAYNASRIWLPSWSDQTRWEYMSNLLFGPHCGSSECLYTIPTAMFLEADVTGYKRNETGSSARDVSDSAARTMTVNLLSQYQPAS